MTFAAPKFRASITLLLGWVIVCGAAHAQGARPQALAPALMISDLHLDPFHDPAKVSQLIMSPVSGWDAILASPDSPTQAQDFAALKATCKQRADDTWYALLVSSLNAIAQNAADVRFVTISGDLLAHELPCKFKAILPNGTQAQYESLTEKTIEFQLRKVKQTLPHAVMYFAFGNNDSNCDDYKLDTDSAWLKAIGGVVRDEMGNAWTPAAAASFAHGGYYSVTMGAPMHHTRLIVVNDIFLAPKFATCSNRPDEASGAEQIEWLKRQLNAARVQHQKVWVMGHIPPGVNPYMTANKGLVKVCMQSITDGGPAMFMANESLGDTLTANGDVIRLAIFAHTHSDEMRLFGAGDKAVAVKFVPSITPYNGNYPSFTVAQVDPATAVMMDYTVFAASDVKGSSWAKEYTFSGVYGHKGYTPATLSALMQSFRADKGDQSPASQAYLRYYSGRNEPVHVPGMIWQAGVCALTNEWAVDFTSCACSGLELGVAAGTH